MAHPHNPRISAPVSPDEFASWLHIGIGRPYLYLQLHDPAPYCDVILDACLHIRVYDPQSEGPRAKYLAEIADAAGVLPIVRDHIIAALPTASDDDWTLSRFVALAQVLAARGDSEALDIFWRRFLLSDLEFAHSLIGEGDLPMFLRVADVVGMVVLAQPDEWFDVPSMISIAEDLHGKEVVREALETATTTNVEIAAFMRSHELTEQNQDGTRAQRSHLLEGLPFHAVQPIIREHRSRWDDRVGQFMHWGETAPDAELLEAALHLSTTLEDLQELRRYLAIFRRRVFPLDPGVLIDLVRRAHAMVDDWDAWSQSDGKRVVIAALLALEQVHHPLVRAFAFEIMNDLDLRNWSTGLLIVNFEDGDYSRIGAYLDSLSNEYIVHAVALDVPRMLELHPSADACPVLWTLYERNPCSVCREKIVTALIDLAALPDWMAHECLHDASLDTRHLVRKHLDQQITYHGAVPSH